jgi:hypothetical protein
VVVNDWQSDGMGWEGMGWDGKRTVVGKEEQGCRVQVAVYTHMCMRDFGTNLKGNHLHPYGGCHYLERRPPLQVGISIYT